MKRRTFLQSALKTIATIAAAAPLLIPLRESIEAALAVPVAAPDLLVAQTALWPGPCDLLATGIRQVFFDHYKVLGQVEMLYNQEKYR